MFVIPPKHRPLHPSGDGRCSAAECRRRDFLEGQRVAELRPRHPALRHADASALGDRRGYGRGVAASFLLRDACPHASPARLARRAGGSSERGKRAPERSPRLASRQTNRHNGHLRTPCVRVRSRRMEPRPGARSPQKLLRPLRAAQVLTGQPDTCPHPRRLTGPENGRSVHLSIAGPMIDSHASRASDSGSRPANLPPCMACDQASRTSRPCCASSHNASLLPSSPAG